MGDHVTMLPATPVSSYMQRQQRWRSVHVPHTEKNKRAGDNLFGPLSECLDCVVPEAPLVCSGKTIHTPQLQLQLVAVTVATLVNDQR